MVLIFWSWSFDRSYRIGIEHIFLLMFQALSTSSVDVSAYFITSVCSMRLKSSRKPNCWQKGVLNVHAIVRYDLSKNVDIKKHLMSTEAVWSWLNSLPTALEVMYRNCIRTMVCHWSLSKKYLIFIQFIHINNCCIFFFL